MDFFRMKFPKDYILLGIAILLFSVATWITKRARVQNHARNIATRQIIDARVLVNSLHNAVRDGQWVSNGYVHLNADTIKDIPFMKRYLNDGLYKSIKNSENEYSLYTTSTKTLNIVCVWGDGPDGIDDVTGQDVAAHLDDLAAFRSAVSYDVTNGPMSTGDIMYWKSEPK